MNILKTMAGVLDDIFGGKNFVEILETIIILPIALPLLLVVAPGEWLYEGEPFEKTRTKIRTRRLAYEEKLNDRDFARCKFNDYDRISFGIAQSSFIGGSFLAIILGSTMGDAGLTIAFLCFLAGMAFALFFDFKANKIRKRFPDFRGGGFW